MDPTLVVNEVAVPTLTERLKEGGVRTENETRFLRRFIPTRIRDAIVRQGTKTVTPFQQACQDRARGRGRYADPGEPA